MVLLSLGLASADTITLPDSSFNTAPGLYGNIAPFGDDSDNTFQLQLLYGASLFHTGGPIQITGLSVRLENGFSGTGTFSNSDYKIDVSSTALSELSTTFDLNHGSDRTTVLDGPLTFNYSTELPPGSLVHSFSDPIVFSTPFTYDPTSGRGLVIHFFEFDANKTGGFYVDRHYDPSLTTTGNQWSPDENSATAYQPVGYLSGQAMILQLHTLPVPEPASIFSLSAVGPVFFFSRRLFVPGRMCQSESGSHQVVDVKEPDRTVLR